MRSCDRTKSSDPDACEGRSSELPEYAARHIERRGPGVNEPHRCTKCKLVIVVDVEWGDLGEN